MQSDQMQSDQIQVLYTEPFTFYYFLRSTLYLDIWDDAQEAEDDQHVDQANHFPQGHDISQR